MNIIITGYYNKNNLGDDLFELYADKLFQSEKFKKQINQYKIIPITHINDGNIDCKIDGQSNIINPDCIVLFGGETLNDFFLDKLISIYENNKKIKKNDKNHKNGKNDKKNTKNNYNNNNCLFKAIGVSCNQEYDKNLINKLQLFDTIIFRSKKDYDFFKERMDMSMTKCAYVPDIVLSLNLERFFTLPNINKYVGFFLSQTALSNLTAEDKTKYIYQITNFIKYWLNKNYKIKLFSMCNNNIESENDNIINELVYNEVCKTILNDKNQNDKNQNSQLNNTLQLNTLQLNNTSHINQLIKHYKSNKDILDKFPKLSFTVCWRYHAHILSIIHNIPFISISQTPKVIDLLEVNNLLLHKVELNESGNLLKSYEEKADYFIKNQIIIKQNMKTIYKKNNKLTYMYLDPFLYTSNNKFNNTFYINNNDIKIIIDYVISNYTSKRSRIIENIDKANLIIFLLMRNINNEYTYGLENKIANGIDNSNENLKKDIEWLINDCILKTNIMFYETVRHIINNNNNNNKYIEPMHNPNAIINIKYILQDDYIGLHRSGWSYVINNLNKYNESSKIVCDLYLDRTFHWKCNDFTKLSVVPYNKPWVGFIHHTTLEDYSENNTVNLFKNSNFIKSLQNCKGLYVLSEHLKEQVLTLIKTSKSKYNSLIKTVIPKIPVYSLTHPTEFVSSNKQFSLDKFNLNTSRKIIQIGAWMRNLNAINILKLGDNPLNLTKTVLKGKNMESYYNEGFSPSSSLVSKNNSRDEEIVMCRDKNTKAITLNNDINIIAHLDNDNYDLLLMTNIVFINLIDASAVNTIIECIVRNTPIFVNRLPATEEALGNSYPLFYNNIEEVTDMLNINKITEGYNYLYKMNKDKFKIENFIREFTETLQLSN